MLTHCSIILCLIMRRFKMVWACSHVLSSPQMYWETLSWLLLFVLVTSPCASSWGSTRMRTPQSMCENKHFSIVWLHTVLRRNLNSLLFFMVTMDCGGWCLDVNHQTKKQLLTCWFKAALTNVQGLLFSIVWT